MSGNKLSKKSKSKSSTGSNEIWNHDFKSWKEALSRDFKLFSRQFTCYRCEERGIFDLNGGNFLSCFHFMCSACESQFGLQCSDHCIMGEKPRKHLTLYTKLYKTYLRKYVLISCANCSEDFFRVDSNGLLKQERAIYTCLVETCSAYICKVCHEGHGHPKPSRCIRELTHGSLWTPPRYSNVEPNQVCEECEVRQCKRCSGNHVDHCCEKEKEKVLFELLREHRKMLKSLFYINKQDAVIKLFKEVHPRTPDIFMDEDEVALFRVRLLREHLIYLGCLLKMATKLKLLKDFNVNIPEQASRPVVCNILDVGESLHLNMREIYNMVLPRHPKKLRSATKSKFRLDKCYCPAELYMMNVKQIHVGLPNIEFGMKASYTVAEVACAPSNKPKALIPVVCDDNISRCSWMTESGEICFYPPKENSPEGQEFFRAYAFADDVRLNLQSLQPVALQEVTEEFWIATSDEGLFSVLVFKDILEVRVQKLIDGRFGKGLVIDSDLNGCVVSALEFIECKIFRIEFSVELAFPIITEIDLQSCLSIGLLDTLTMYRTDEGCSMYAVCYHTGKGRLRFLEHYGTDGGACLCTSGAYGSPIFDNLTYNRPTILSGGTDGVALFGEVNNEGNTPSHIRFIDIGKLAYLNHTRYAWELDLPISDLEVSYGECVDVMLRRTEAEDFQLLALFYHEGERMARVFCIS